VPPAAPPASKAARPAPRDPSANGSLEGPSRGTTEHELFEKRTLAMDKRRLGRSELMVSPLCLGGNVFGWTADERTSFRLLDAFLDAGMNFIDTADVYSSWVPGNK